MDIKKLEREIDELWERRTSMCANNDCPHCAEYALKRDAAIELARTLRPSTPKTEATLKRDVNAEILTAWRAKCEQALFDGTGLEQFPANRLKQIQSGVDLAREEVGSCVNAALALELVARLESKHLLWADKRRNRVPDGIAQAGYWLRGLITEELKNAG